MAVTDLPIPVRRNADQPQLDVRRLAADLAARVDGEVRFDAGSRAAYSTDSSNFRQLPIGVVVPKSVDAAVDAVTVCREHGAPVLSRGGGTSLAGECTNVAVVLDWSKYCHRLESVDAEARTCVVEPGIVLDHLNDQLSRYGLEYGPRPATHPNCTIGGMIGNNSCGATAQRTGKVVDNVVRLEVLTYDGLRMWVGATSDEEYADIVRTGGRRGEIYRQLRDIADRYGEEIRFRYPDIPRRVSGFNLDSLLPEKHFNLAQALVGSEATCVTVLRAELTLVPVVPARTVVVLGFDDIGKAADAVPVILPHEPIALEGMDHRLIDFQQRKHLNPEALKLLPEGPGYLLVQFGGETREDADRQARGMLDALERSEHGPRVSCYDDEEHEEQLWQVRESGLGATARVPGMNDTWPGWEDAAVPPERLGDYLRDLLQLYDEFGYAEASVYGHFGHGCVHSRIPFDLQSAAGVAAYRRFLERAADLVVSYGGSFSGEHGDGQQRAELLPKMFGAELVRAMGEFKAAFDPEDRMNPGKVVAPYRLDENLRLGASWSPEDVETYFKYPHDEGSFSRAVTRCVGVGKCRREGGGVMCPSYMVTREEEHSTRGRARLLFEMLDGHGDSPVSDGWRSTAVRDALDLCLACKGCKTDCPVNVDMATYKAEFLAHHYAGHLRPAAHYSMGWLPVWARLAALAPRAVNALAAAPGLTDVAKALGGVAREREVPLFAGERFTDWYRRRGPRGSGERGELLLWPDTFSDNFHPAVARSAVEVLEAAGFRVRIPDQTLCCGLTWISTGQLTTARRVLRRTVDALRDDIRAGVTVVGLEPSCTAVFRADAPELFPHDQDVLRLRDQTRTFAEVLSERAGDWRPPPVDRHAVIQTHCHQHAVMGFDTDLALMRSYGVDPEVLDAGCCGLAGNFGFEDGHYEVSRACGERVLLPAVREAERSSVILADGFSCRTQIEQGDTGRQAMHLAELLAASVRGGLPAETPEQAVGRPGPPGRLAKLAALGGVTAAAVCAAGLAVVIGRARR